MTKKATPLQKLKVAKRTRARARQEEEEKKRRASAKPPPSASLFATNEGMDQQLMSPSTSPPRKKLKSIQEAGDGSNKALSNNQADDPDTTSAPIQATPTATNVRQAAAASSIPVRTIPIGQPAAATLMNQFRSIDDNTVEDEDQTRGDETQEDTDVEHDNDDGEEDTVVDQQLPSSIKVQLTLETAPDNANTANSSSSSRSGSRGRRSNLVDPLSATLAAASTTPQNNQNQNQQPNRRMFRPIRSQSESWTATGTPPSQSLMMQPPAVKQPPPKNPLEIYNQFAKTTSNDDDENAADGHAVEDHPPAFSASAASSFAPINPTRVDHPSQQNVSQPYPIENDENYDDRPMEEENTHLYWKLGKYELIDWQGKNEMCLGLLLVCCLGFVALASVGMVAKTFWDIHRFQYLHLEQEYETLVDILVETKMQPIPHQFCIFKEDNNQSNRWWMPPQPAVLKEVMHSDQSRHSILQMQEQIGALQAELKFWKNDANAKEAELAGFKDQHEQDWNDIMNECSKAMSNGMNDQDGDTVDSSLRQAAFEALDNDLRSVTHNGPTALELLQEMQELNRMLDQSNAELIQETVEWERNMEELYEAYQKLQHQTSMEHQQRALEDERFHEEYQFLVKQRNTLAHETKLLEQQAAEMKHLIQEDSRKRLAVWLGDGPFYEVEFKLHFQDEDSHSFHYITVELDGQNMPHSVFTFVSQVELGAYQGQTRTPAFWFSQVGSNAVLGLPTDFESLDGWSSLPSLVFQEMSENVSTEPYALGWIGMGPELYFGSSMAQNPPFGRVTRGTEVIDRMYDATRLESSEDRQLHQLEHPVSLVSVTIF